MRELKLYDRYTRDEVRALFEPEEPFTPGAGRWGLQGIIELKRRPQDFIFFVSYGRSVADHDFDEGISPEGVLTWQSQPRHTFASRTIEHLISHDDVRSNIYLFLRPDYKGAPPYTYFGRLKYLRHDPHREKPVYFHWQILDWNPPPQVLSMLEQVMPPPFETSPTLPPPGRDPEPPASGSVTVDEHRREFRARRAPDWSEQDANNRALGLAGELFTVEFEKNRLTTAGRADLAEQVRHVAVEVGDGLGYDVASFEVDGSERYIEVKTTRGPSSTDFFVSENERAFSNHSAENYYLYRVFNFDETEQRGELLLSHGALEALHELSPTTYRVRRRKEGAFEGLAAWLSH